MERYNEEEKELLMRVAKEIRYDPGRIPPNLRYTDMKKVREATVKINKIVSLIKTEKKYRNKLSITCCWQCCC